MPVYVDALLEWGPTPTWPYKMACHLIADTEEELQAFAKKIGLNPKWFQASPPHRVPHYDLTSTMRIKAVKAGATPVEKDRDRVEDCLRWWWMIARQRNKKQIQALRREGYCGFSKED